MSYIFKRAADYTNFGDYADAWLIGDYDEYLLRDLSIIGRFRSL